MTDPAATRRTCGLPTPKMPVDLSHTGTHSSPDGQTSRQSGSACGGGQRIAVTRGKSSRPQSNNTQTTLSAGTLHPRRITLYRVGVGVQPPSSRQITMRPAFECCKRYCMQSPGSVNIGALAVCGLKYPTVNRCRGGETWRCVGIWGALQGTGSGTVQKGRAYSKDKTT